METDELAIYAWINPVKPPERVKMERYRMVVMLAVRYGVHHYLDDLWQDWQLGVHQRTRIPEILPVEQREAFSFGIARNLCRSLLRKDPPISVPVLGSSEEPDGRPGIREGELEKRRLDHPAASLVSPSESGIGPTAWVDSDRLRNCLQRLRPRTLEILRKTYEDGKSSAEIGQETGLSAENVRQQLRRSRDEVRNCLGAGRQKGEDWKHAQIHE